ncbi:MAG: electron transfer flavoprotein subunit beta/FixA family protein, partial [Pseudomonadota bacterium]
EALQVKQQAGDAKITVVTVGPKKRCVDSLRTALAMGADDAIVVDTDAALDPFLTAKALAAAIQKQEDGADLIFTGKLAIDDNASAVSQYLAEFLSIGHATVVSSFEYAEGKLTAERETEGGTREVYQIEGAAVIAANKGLNTPRYASLPGIMKAKKKPLAEFTLEDLGIAADQIKTKFVNFELPAEKPPVQMIDGDVDAQVKSLVSKLKEEAKVL